MARKMRSPILLQGDANLMGALDEIKSLLEGFNKDIDGLFNTIRHLEKDWDKEIDVVHVDIAYIKGKLDEGSKHNSSLVEAYKKQVKEQTRLLKWFMTLVIGLIIIIATLLGVKVPLP